MVLLPLLSYPQVRHLRGFGGGAGALVRLQVFESALHDKPIGQYCGMAGEKAAQK